MYVYVPSEKFNTWRLSYDLSDKIYFKVMGNTIDNNFFRHIVCCVFRCIIEVR